MKSHGIIYFIIISFVYISLPAQTIKPGVVRIIYDTTANTPIRKMLGPIENDKSNAFIGFDSGFENDSVEVWMNKKLAASGFINSKLDVGNLGGFQISKAKKMKIVIVVKNRKEKFDVIFDKKFSVAHLRLDPIESKLFWTYSNQVYNY